MVVNSTKNIACYFLLAWIWRSFTPIVAHPKIRSDIEEPVARLILQHGYPLEIYEDVQTADGYLLNIYRIPHGKKPSNVRVRKPVLLMHGMFGCSGIYVDFGPKRGLGFTLADRSYDVWLPNARGTPQSRKHVKLNPDNGPDFWYFGWHEIAMYDLPVIFDLIKNVTKQEKLGYIGVSEGTTIFYVLASEVPAFNERVSVMVSLAPTAYMEHFKNPLVKFLASFAPLWEQFAQITGIQELYPWAIKPLVNMVVSNFCRGRTRQDFCASIFYLVGGISTQFDQTHIPVTANTSLSGTSVRQILHYAQNIRSGKFSQYDFGPEKNMLLYGSPTPPLYNMTKITAPMALYYAENDKISNYKDVENLCNNLANCVHTYKVPYRQFNHFDFVTAIDVIKLVYNDLYKTIDKYSRGVS